MSQEGWEAYNKYAYIYIYIYMFGYSLWAHHGPVMDPSWAISPSRAQHWPIMSRSWPHHGPIMGHRPIMGPAPTHSGPIMGASNGPNMGPLWANHGSALHGPIRDASYTYIYIHTCIYTYTHIHIGRVIFEANKVPTMGRS
jgi:hypothetical protein